MSSEISESSPTLDTAARNALLSLVRKLATVLIPGPDIIDICLVQVVREKQTNMNYCF